MLIRKTEPRDIKAAAEIYDQAKKYMRENGNPTQWDGDYPNERDVTEDMEKGIGYVCEDNGEIVAVFIFAVGEDKDYKEIYDGEWKNDDEYAVIHRIAVKYHGRGIVDFCFSECFKMYPNIKMDTHRNNKPMQKVLARAGFEYCGVIHVEDPSRPEEENYYLAYQKTK